LKKLFSVDVAIIATAYIVADSEAEAQEIANSLADEALEFSSRQQHVGVDAEIVITGESYSADMPELTLSPAMTVVGVQGRTVDYQEDLPEEVDCGQCEGTGTTDAMGHAEECPVCDGSGKIMEEVE
jgi:hypothetical protein